MSLCELFYETKFFGKTNCIKLIIKEARIHVNERMIVHYGYFVISRFRSNQSPLFSSSLDGGSDR